MPNAVPLSWSLATGFLHILLTNERVPLLYPLTLVYQVSIGLGTFSPTEARKGSPLLHMCWEAMAQPLKDRLTTKNIVFLPYDSLYLPKALHGRSVAKWTMWVK